MIEAEVVIVGAGPAGATAALNLAPLRRVVMVERQAEIRPRIGESLVPAARRLLADMGLWENFLTQRHESWYGNRSVWGNPEPQELDFLRQPDGPGWHLDRPCFERWLRQTAIERGAVLLTPATLSQAQNNGQKWQLRLKTADGELQMTADLLIDAGGRSAPVARQLGVRTRTDDQLVCAWLYGRDEGEGGRGLTYVEAVENGWWYTAPLPERQRVLAFHTDSDLGAARNVRSRSGLLEASTAAKELSTLLRNTGFVPESETGFVASNSAVLDPPAGENWLAAGDAAISFDPISSQGLFNALFTGLAAAEHADRYLRGETVLSEYSALIDGIRAAYQKHLSACYTAERRWPESTFWLRRRC